MVRLRTLVLFALAVTAVLAPAGVAKAVGGSYSKVSARDDFFDQDVIRVPAGATVEWANDGRNAHNVIADDGSFRSGTLAAGGEFIRTFPVAGAFRYYCSFHGAAGGIGMSGLVLVGNAKAPGSRYAVGPGREKPPNSPGATIQVPADRPTIQSAVDAARPGALILVSPGVYRESVLVTTPFLTIRGTDRNRVVLDGGFTRTNGIQVIEADGVAVENMTARHYQANGFYWASVFGYRGSYLTAYDDGDYGVYAFDSQYGQFDHSYASGHPDSGFYIGQCYPCHAVITNVLSEDNALGFSGTNAGGDLRIIDSEWRDNMGGIVPNTLDSELLAPQRDVLIAGNYVHDNGNVSAPAKPLQYPSLGTGILIGGGNDDLVVHNLVEDNGNYGILVTPNIDANLWFPEGNRVRDNLVRRSGRADLALAAPAAGGNCFSGNDFRTSLPPAIQTFYGCGTKLNPAGGGDLATTVATLALFGQAQSGRYPHGDWRTEPAPPRQRPMPGARLAPPDPAVAGGAVPERFDISDARTLRERDDGHTVRPQMTILGFPLAATWWGLLVGVYGYVLPLILYAAWVSIAMWDLVRRERLTDRTRVLWMAAVLLLPLVGPIAYFAFGRSPIPRSLRLMLVAGGLGIYLVVAALGYVIGSS